MEMMTVGIPVVASRTGGIPEMVQEGVTGYLVSPGDTGELAEHLERLIADAHIRERMSSAGRERACSHFSIERHVQQVMNLYDEVLSD